MALDLKEKTAAAVRPEKSTITFLSPELVAAGLDDDISGYAQKPNWDVAVRYQDLKRLLSIPEHEKKKIKKRAIAGVIDQARAVMGSVLKPERSKLMTYDEFTASGAKGELDITATIDEMVSSGVGYSKEFHYGPLRFDARVEKNQDIALIMDASLSMNGEKIALLAVAAAVVALCVPSKKLALMAFASQTRIIKPFGEEVSIEKIVERILEIPTLGLTNLELALQDAAQMLTRYAHKGANVILVSDGKYTEGKDPTFLAKQFQKLHVLKLGRDIAGHALLLDLVRAGNGRFFEVRRMTDLPRTIYGAMKTLLR